MNHTSFNAALLVGLWSGSGDGPNGLRIDSSMAIRADGTFSGDASIQGQLIWTFVGTWRVDGCSVAFAYLESSRPLPENYIDTDDIESIDDNLMVSTSRLSGKQHILVRVG